MIRGIVFGTALPLLLCLVVASQSASGAAVRDPGDPVRILIVGDSVTQGSSGDWTWRYRLWDSLESDGVAADFVGPRDDLRGLGADTEWSHDYVEPDFDRDHAARWGMAMAFQDTPIGELVRRYRPGILVEMLGVNDLIWLGVSPAAVNELARQFIAEAREADPNIALVMAHIPQTWIAGASEYNALLDATVAELSTEASPIEVAHVDEGFDLREDTWDPAHPNSRGELVLASGVQDAMAQLGVGEAFQRPLPTVPLGPRKAASLRSVAGDGWVSLTWSNQEGSTGQIIERRDRAIGTSWKVMAEVSGTADWRGPAVNGHRYEFRLRPVKGYWSAAADIRSNVVTATPRPAAPRTVGATGSPFGRATVRWSPVARAESYQVRYRRARASHWKTFPRQQRRRLRVDSLKGGRAFEFQVRSWRSGVPSSYRSTGAVTVPPPRRVRRLRLSSPDRDRVQATARSRPEATRYQFRAVGVRSCRKQPRPSTFRLLKTSRVPKVRFATRSRALWVSVVAVRRGAASYVGKGSVRCVRVK